MMTDCKVTATVLQIKNQCKAKDGIAFATPSLHKVNTSLSNPPDKVCCFILNNHSINRHYKFYLLNNLYLNTV